MPTGIVPPDPSSEIGRLRILLGDVSYTEDAANPALGEYAVFGDLELEAFLFEGGSVLRGAAIATRRLALEYAASGQSIRVEDLAIDLKGRGADLLAVSKSFQSEADYEDERNGTGAFADVFLITPGRPLPSDGFTF